MKQEQLTPKQQLFVENYINNDGDHIQAYKDSGYTATSDNSLYAGVNRLLKNVKVSAQIARYKAGNLAKQAKKREKIDIDQDWLISQLITTIEDARSVNQHNVSRNCIMDIGKVLGLVIDRKEINAQLSIDAQLTQLDTSTLIQALTEAKKPEAIEGKFHEISDE
jgi:phage terminase small subunit